MLIIYILFVIILFIIDKKRKKEYMFEYKNTIIEKNIFQFNYKKFEDLPQMFKNNIDKIKKENPEYKYKYFIVGSNNDEEVIKYIQKNYGEKYVKLYNSIGKTYGATKADFFRYLLLYKEGGVYLDIKASINKPLREIIKEDDEYLLTSVYSKYLHKYLLNNINLEILNINNKYLNTGFGEFLQSVIICRKNHPFLKNVIKNVVKNMENYKFDPNNKFTYGLYGVWHLTGPVVYTKSILSLINKYNYTFKYNRYDKSFKTTINYILYVLNIIINKNKTYHTSKTPILTH